MGQIPHREDCVTTSSVAAVDDRRSYEATTSGAIDRAATRRDKEFGVRRLVAAFPRRNWLRGRSNVLTSQRVKKRGQVAALQNFACRILLLWPNRWKIRVGNVEMASHWRRETGPGIRRCYRREGDLAAKVALNSSKIKQNAQSCHDVDDRKPVIEIANERFGKASD